MKKATLILAAIMAMVSTHAWADPIIRPDTLRFVFTGPGNGGGNDGGGGHGGPQSPVYPPFVVKVGHTLYLYSGCEGATIALIDEDDDEVYSEEIAEGTQYLVLPEWLEGTYELQIRLGQYVFSTEITL